MDQRKGRRDWIATGKSPDGIERSSFERRIDELRNRKTEWVRSVDTLLASDIRREQPPSSSVQSLPAVEPDKNRPLLPSANSFPVDRAEIHEEDKSMEAAQSKILPQSKLSAGNRWVGDRAGAKKKLSFPLQDATRSQRSGIKNVGLSPRIAAGAKFGKLMPKRNRVRMSRSLNRLNVRLKAVKKLQGWWRGTYGRIMRRKWFVLVQQVLSRSHSETSYESKVKDATVMPKIDNRRSVPRNAWGGSASTPTLTAVAPVTSRAQNERDGINGEGTGQKEEQGYAGRPIPEGWLRERDIFQPGSSHPGVEKARAYVRGYIARAVYTSRECVDLRGQIADIENMIRDLEIESGEKENEHQTSFRRRLQQQISRIKVKVAALFEPPGRRKLSTILRGAKQTQAQTTPGTPTLGTGALSGVVRKAKTSSSSKKKNWTPTDLSIRFLPGPVGLGLKTTSPVVNSVQPGKQAESKGIQPGWIITEINGRHVKDAKKVMLMLTSCKNSPRPYTVGFSKRRNQTKSKSTTTAAPRKIAWGGRRDESPTTVIAETKDQNALFQDGNDNQGNSICAGSTGILKNGSSAVLDTNGSTKSTPKKCNNSNHDQEEGLDLGLGDDSGGRHYLKKKRVKTKISHKLNWDAKPRTVSRLETRYIRNSSGSGSKMKTKNKTRASTGSHKKKPKKMDFSKIKSRIDSRWGQNDDDEDSDGHGYGLDERPKKDARGKKISTESRAGGGLEATLKKPLKPKPISYGTPEEIRGDKDDFFISVSDYRRALNVDSATSNSKFQQQQQQQPEMEPESLPEHQQPRSKDYSSEAVAASELAAAVAETIRYPYQSSARDENPSKKATLVLDRGHNGTHVRGGVRSSEEEISLGDMSMMLTDVEQTVELLVGSRKKLHVFEPPNHVVRAGGTQIPHVRDASAIFRMIEDGKFQAQLQALRQ